MKGYLNSLALTSASQGHNMTPTYAIANIKALKGPVVNVSKVLLNATRERTQLLHRVYTGPKLVGAASSRDHVVD